MNYVEVDVQIMHTRANAVLVSDGTTDAWIPKDALPDWDSSWGPGDYVIMSLPEEMAVEKGLV